jgi:hypothetical protein
MKIQHKRLIILSVVFFLLVMQKFPSFNGILALKASKFIGHLRFKTGPEL